MVRVAREVPVKVELPARIGRLQNGEVHARLDFRADLDGVPSANEAQAVDNVVNVLDFDRRLVLRAAEAA